MLKPVKCAAVRVTVLTENATAIVVFSQWITVALLAKFLPRQVQKTKDFAHSALVFTAKPNTLTVSIAFFLALA